MGEPLATERVTRDDMDAVADVEPVRVPATEYECVYCGHACTRTGHVDPARDTHRVMAVIASWAITSDLRTARVLKRLMEGER